MLVNKLRMWLGNHWRILILAGSGVLFSMSLLLSNITQLIPGISEREALLNQHTSSLSAISHNPAGLPINLLHWIIGLSPFHGPFWLRTPSIVLALITLLSMVYIMRRWYGPRTMLFGFLLFASSAWFLHVSRLGTTDIMYLLALPLLIAAHIVLHDLTESKLATYFWFVCNLTLLYVPGMAWFVLLNLLLQRTELAKAWSSLKTWPARLGIFAISLLILSPLMYGLIVGSTRTAGLELLGLPTTLPHLSELGMHLRDAVLFIAIRGNAPTDMWLNHLPILDAFMMVLFIAGVYFYSKHWRAGRTRLLGGFFVYGLLLITLGGSVTISLIVPLLYLIAAAGLAYLLHHWLVVFPRNPLARGFGIGLLSVAVAVSCLYGLRQYFVAWPHHPATQTAFSQHKIEPSHR
jgi:hypothetical protein